MDFSALTGNRVYKLLKATFDDWMEDKALRLSAALAYYSIFSIAPLLVIAISIAGLVLGDAAVRGQLDVQLREYVGPQAAASVQAMVQSAAKPAQGWTGAIVGVVTLLVGAAGVFGQLKDALNTVWEVKSKGVSGVWGFIREHLWNFGMVLVIGFLLLTSLLLTTALTSFNQYFESVSAVPPFVGGLLAFAVSFGVVTTLFAFIFKVLPDAQIKWGHVWVGAIVTALLFELGKFGLSYYLGRASTASSFGAAGSVVLILLWVYYASCILLFGAEFTQIYARERDEEVPPAVGAVPVTAESRAQQGLAPVEVSRSEPPPIQTQFVEVPVPFASGPALGALLAVTAAGFVAGVIAGRRA